MLQNKGALQEKLAEIRRSAEERDAKRRAQSFGLPYIDLRSAPTSIQAVSLVDEQSAKEAKLASIQKQDDKIAVAVYNPGLEKTKEAIENLRKKGKEVKVFVASLSGLEKVWHLYAFVSGEKKQITGSVSIEQKRLEELTHKLTSVQTTEQELNEMDYSHVSVTNLFEVVLAGALANRASDIHIEEQEEQVRVRFRIDGVLHDVVGDLPKKNYASLLSRIKLISEMKINVHGEPQDGRFTIDLTSKQIEVRVSIIPSEYGEAVVMRLLDPDVISLSMEELGMRPDDLQIAESVITQPHGLVINTGPTGSGKTTTLYAFLKKRTSPENKLITVEDPVEYHLEGVEQTQIDPDAGYTFASGLRAIVRQDPDIILIGEIRDLETASIALQASLTGHLVFSTLHTNDAVGAIPRLIDVGAKPRTVGPALSLVIAQRLVRRLCDECKRPAKLTEEHKQKHKKFLEDLPDRVDTSPYKDPVVYEAVGCDACNQIGYKGRVAVFEFFQGGSEFEQRVLKDTSEVALRELANEQGMVTLQQDGMLKVFKGTTSLEELTRVTGSIEWGKQSSRTTRNAQRETKDGKAEEPKSPPR